MNGRGFASYAWVVVRSEIASWPGAIGRVAGRLGRAVAYYLFVLRTELRLWRSSYHLFVLRYEVRAGAGRGARLVRRGPRVLAATLIWLLFGLLQAVSALAGAARQRAEERRTARRQAAEAKADLPVLAPAAGGSLLPRPRTVAVGVALVVAAAVPGHALVASLLDAPAAEVGAAGPAIPVVPAVPLVPTVPLVPVVPLPAGIGGPAAVAAGAAVSSAAPPAGNGVAAATLPGPPGWSLGIVAGQPTGVPAQKSHRTRAERRAAHEAEKAALKAVHKAVKYVAAQRAMAKDQGK